VSTSEPGIVIPISDLRALADVYRATLHMRDTLAEFDDPGAWSENFADLDRALVQVRPFLVDLLREMSDPEDPR
jgi:hypothetical protein